MKIACKKIRPHFIVLLICSLLLLIFSSIYWNHDLFATILSMLLVGAATIAVIFWQGSLIKNQIQFQTYLELDKEWNSNEMLEYREDIETICSDETQLHRLETILEFFEKFAMFKTRSAMDMDFILRSDLGFYAVRYYYYNKKNKNIDILREKYKEPSYYEELENLYKDYLEFEEKSGGKKIQGI
jgi:hypothetical protein